MAKKWVGEKSKRGREYLGFNKKCHCLNQKSSPKMIKNDTNIVEKFGIDFFLKSPLISKK